MSSEYSIESMLGGGFIGFFIGVGIAIVLGLPFDSVPFFAMLGAFLGPGLIGLLEELDKGSKTGSCVSCNGTGREVIGHGTQGQTSFGTCKSCGGTGKV